MPNTLKTMAVFAHLTVAAGALGQATITPLPSWPAAITPDGSTVVGSFGTNDAQTIYRWTAQGGVVPIGAATSLGPWVTGVSADGGVVVALSVDQGYRWTAADGWQTYFNGGFATARGVSADGSVAVGAVAPNHQVTAVRFTGINSYQVIGPLGSWATGVSARRLGRVRLPQRWGVQQLDVPLGRSERVHQPGRPAGGQFAVE